MLGQYVGKRSLEVIITTFENETTIEEELGQKITFLRSRSRGFSSSMIPILLSTTTKPM